MAGLPFHEAGPGATDIGSGAGLGIRSGPRLPDESPVKSVPSPRENPLLGGTLTASQGLALPADELPRRLGLDPSTRGQPGSPPGVLFAPRWMVGGLGASG
jgi:hypothetical protein